MDIENNKEEIYKLYELLNDQNLLNDIDNDKITKILDLLLNIVLKMGNTTDYLKDIRDNKKYDELFTLIILFGYYIGFWCYFRDSNYCREKPSNNILGVVNYLSEIYSYLLFYLKQDINTKLATLLYSTVRNKKLFIIFILHILKHKDFDKSILDKYEYCEGFEEDDKCLSIKLGKTNKERSLDWIL